MTPDRAEACGRCGTELTGPFCSQCGQRRAEVLALGPVLREFIGKVGELDLGLWRTLKGLSLRPGHLIRDYLAGDRASYTHPGKYMFWMATAYALSVTFLLDPALVDGAFFDQVLSRELLLFVMGSVAYLAFLYQLIAAAAVYALFRPGIRTVGEGYVALLYIYGHGLFGLSVLAAFDVWSPTIVRVVLPVYMTWALVQLSGRSLIVDLLKAIVVYVVYSIATVLVIGAVIAGRQLLAGAG